MILKARMEDAEEIQKLINGCASKGEMLPRSINDIYENLRDFFVWKEKGELAACCALHIVWKNLAEIRSLAVKPDSRRKGIASRLAEKCLDEAKDFGIKEVFVLTYISQFFSKMGFRTVKKEKLPHKIWNDCINCVKFPNCDEIALVKIIRRK